MIDPQVALRIFLEYYIREKKVRAFILKRLFEEESKNNFGPKGGVTFEIFKRIIT